MMQVTLEKAASLWGGVSFKLTAFYIRDLDTNLSSPNCRLHSEWSVGNFFSELLS